MCPAKRYKVPKRVCRVRQEIKGSRFITTACSVSNVADAKTFIGDIRSEFPDATHNCWAYVIGPPGSTFNNGSSDDGEPGGTAGTPMLNVLLGCGVGDIVAVVTRYYGGVKLGRGGLIRAYSGGVQSVLRELPLTERIHYAAVGLEVEYTAVEAVRRLLTSYEGEIDEQSFGTSVRFRLRIPEEHLAPFRKSVMDVTKGEAKFEMTLEEP